MADPVIQTHELVKIFKDFWHRPRVKAVDGVSFSVNRGEVFGLLGPNGSGKSTTIKLILGLLFPTKGHISILGKVSSDVAIKRHVGFLPEESYLYEYLDAEETLDFYARLFDIPARERKSRIDSLLRLTGLQASRHRLLNEFSKGMARRIGIAQALINDPDIVILDEPTTGLDPIGTREIKDLIIQLKERGKTVILSSHLLADVEDVCDRVVILYGGRIQAEGTTGELLRQEKLTQITAEMDEATVKEVTELIRKRQGADKEVKVHPPVERLENFFLRIVEEARASNQPTSGVGASEKGLSFLTQAAVEPEDVLSRLTIPEEEATPSTGTSTPEPEPVAPMVAAKSDNAEVLSKLTAAPKPAPVAQAEPVPDDTEKDKAASPEGIEKEVNHGILDKLTQKNDNSTDQKEDQ